MPAGASRPFYPRCTDGLYRSRTCSSSLSSPADTPTNTRTSFILFIPMTLLLRVKTQSSNKVQMGPTHRCLNNLFGLLPAQNRGLQRRGEKTSAKLQYVINVCHKLSRHVYSNAAPLTGQLKMYFITQFGISGWIVRRSAGLGFSASAFLYAAYARGASRGKNRATGTSLFIFTIFLESFGERGKTGMFMKVSRWSRLHPQLFFSVLGP